MFDQEGEGSVPGENPLFPWTCLSRHIRITMTINNHTKSFNLKALRLLLGCEDSSAFCLASGVILQAQASWRWLDVGHLFLEHEETIQSRERKIWKRNLIPQTSGVIVGDVRIITFHAAMVDT